MITVLQAKLFDNPLSLGPKQLHMHRVSSYQNIRTPTSSKLRTNYCKTTKWGWDINPLVPGWGTGPEKTRFTKCLGFALDWNLVFFWFLVPGWFLNSEIRPPEKIVYTSRFWTGKPNCCNDHIYHSHASELLNLGFFNLKGRGWGQGLTMSYIFIEGVNDPTPCV